jgi:hypothetical protein
VYIFFQDLDVHKVYNAQDIHAGILGGCKVLTILTTETLREQLCPV